MENPPTSFSSVIFTKTTRDLDCPLCFQVFVDPVQCKDGHIFCRDCLFLALKKKQECPICKTKLTTTTICANLYVKNAIQESEVYCFSRLTELESASIVTTDGDKCTVHCDWTGKLQDANKQRM